MQRRLLGQRVGQRGRACRRSSSAGSPSWSASSSADERVGEHLDQALVRPASSATTRRTRCSWVRPRPSLGLRQRPTGSGRSRASARPPRRGRARRRGRDARTAAVTSTCVTSVPSPVSSTSQPMVAQDADDLARGGSRRPRAGRQRWRRGRMPCASACGRRRCTPSSAVPPPCSTSRSTASCAAAAATVGSTPRSKRLDASVMSGAGATDARDRRRVEVRGLDEDVGRRAGDLGGRTAHDAGDGQRLLAAVGDEQVLGVQRALDVVERRELLATARPADDDRAATAGRRSKACSGWPSGEHDVVGDVDGERDRAHARPGSGACCIHAGDGPRRVDAPHDPRDVAVAADAALDRRRRP